MKANKLHYFSDLRNSATCWFLLQECVTIRDPLNVEILI